MGGGGRFAMGGGYFATGVGIGFDGGRRDEGRVRTQLGTATQRTHRCSAESGHG